jgi:acyl-CoA thioester hydrolase
MPLWLAVIAASCTTGGMALASKPWGGGQSASKPPRELLGRGAYAHFETIPTRWNDMDAQQHVWFSVSMRAIAAMAFRPTRLRRDPRHRRDVLYAQVNNAVYHFYIDDAVNLHLARSGVPNDVRRFTSENSCRYLRQLSWPTPVEVGLRVRLGRASAAYQLGLFAENDEDASAIGTFTHIYVDDRGKPCRMDESVRTALEPLVPDDGL